MTLPDAFSVFSVVGEFFAMIGKSVGGVFVAIGNFAKTFPFVFRIMSNVARIVGWYLITVLKKYIDNFIILLELLVIIIKRTIELIKNAVNAIKDAVDGAQADLDKLEKLKKQEAESKKAGRDAYNEANKPENKPEMTPLMKMVMAINDIPFATIFRPITWLVEQFKKFFEWKPVKVTMYVIKMILWIFLDIQLAPICIGIYAMTGLWDALGDFLGMLGMSHSTFLPGALISIFEGLKTFRDDWCFASVKSLIPKPAARVYTNQELYLMLLKKLLVSNHKTSIDFYTKINDEFMIFELPTFKSSKISNFDIYNRFPFEKKKIIKFLYQQLN